VKIEKKNRSIFIISHYQTKSTNPYNNQLPINTDAQSKINQTKNQTKNQKKGFRLVGLTGSISTGKSTVSRTLKNLGIPVIDFDLISREVVAPNSSCLNAIAKEFGEDVLLPDGNLDRAKLGEIIFSDVSKRRKLDAIMKRPIMMRFLWLLLKFFLLGQIPSKSTSTITNTAADEGPLSPSHGILTDQLYPGLEQSLNGTKIIVLDCPLLFESGISNLCTSTVFINCDDKTQLERLMKRDNITTEVAEQKIKAQWNKDDKSKLASYL
jgi:dephospho-CoA kinase